MSSKYNVVENDYDNVNPDFHNSYDTTTEFKDEIELFTTKIQKKGRILNIGGTASECNYFLKQSFKVEDIDLSQAMLDHISANAKGTIVAKKNIRDFSSTEPYDGIWACRSLIHIPPDDLPKTLKNIHSQLKNEGWFGAVFFLSELSHIEEQEVPEEHTDKEGVVYYRTLYPKEILLDIYRKAGLTPMFVSECVDRDGDKGIFVLAQHTFFVKQKPRDWVFGAWLNRIKRMERIMQLNIDDADSANEYPYDVAYILFPLLDAISFNLFGKSSRTYLTDMQKRYGDIGLSNKEADLLIKVFRNGMTHVTHMNHLDYYDGDIGWGLSSGAGSGGIRPFDFGYVSEEYPEDNMPPENVFEYIKFDSDIYHASLSLERLIALVRDDLEKRKAEYPDTDMPFIVGQRQEGKRPEARLVSKAE